MTMAYHTLKDFVHKVDVMHKKSKDLALLKDTAHPEEVKYICLLYTSPSPRDRG